MYCRRRSSKVLVLPHLPLAVFLLLLSPGCGSDLGCLLQGADVLSVRIDILLLQLK